MAAPQKRIVTCDFTQEEMVLIGTCLALGAAARASDVPKVAEGLLILHTIDDLSGPMQRVMGKIKLILEQDERLAELFKTGGMLS